MFIAMARTGPKLILTYPILPLKTELTIYVYET